MTKTFEAVIAHLRDYLASNGIESDDLRIEFTFKRSCDLSNLICQLRSEWNLTSYLRYEGDIVKIANITCRFGLHERPKWPL